MKKIFVLFAVLIPIISNGHLRGGDISVSQFSNSMECMITLRIYSNKNSPVQVGNGALNFGDGSAGFVTPSKGWDTSLSPDIGIVTYTIVHTFPGGGSYTLTYLENNLDAGILNIFNSVETPLYLQAWVNLDPFYGRNRTPTFLDDGVFHSNLRDTCRLSMAPIDVIGTNYSYTFELVALASWPAFRIPATLSIDRYSGLLSWDTKFEGGFYNAGTFIFPVRVSYYNESGIKMGYVLRVIEIVLDDVATHVVGPLQTGSGRTYVAPDETKTIKVILSDNASADSLTWYLHNDIQLASNISFVQHDSSTSDKKFKVGTLTIHATASIERDNPYDIIVRGVSYSQGTPRFADVGLLLFTRDIPLPDITTATKPTSERRITVHPNPFSNYFYIEGCYSESTRWTLVDLQGRVVLPPTTDWQSAIDASGLSPGSYLLRTSDGHQDTVSLVVKQ